MGQPICSILQYPKKGSNFSFVKIYITANISNGIYSIIVSSSLTARFRKFEELNLEKSSKKLQKEASKVLEYVNTVERGLQCCEILQSLMHPEQTKRTKYLKTAGLKLIRR